MARLLELPRDVLLHLGRFLFPGPWRFDVCRDLWRPEELLGDSAPLLLQNWRLARFAPPRLRGDLELMLKVCDRDGRAVRYALEPLRVLSRAPQLLRFCSRAVKADREAALLCLREVSLLHFAPSFREDRELVLMAVRSDPGIFRSCGHFADDEEIAGVAVRRMGAALRHASARLRSSPAFVHSAIVGSNCPSAWQWALGEASRDAEVILAALSLGASSLKFAPDCVRDDKALALRAVRLNAFAIHYVSPRLMRDRDVVMAALHQHPRAIAITDQHLDDQHLMLLAVRRCGTLLCHATPRLRGDRVLVLEAVRQCGLALQFASEELRDDLEVVLEAVESRGTAWMYASDRLRLSPEVAQATLISDPRSALAIGASSPPGLFDDLLVEAIDVVPDLLHVLPGLREDRAAVSKALRQRGRLLASVPAFADDDELVALAVASDGDALAFASQCLRGQRVMALRAVATSPDALRFASSELRDDEAVVRVAIGFFQYALAFASDRLRSSETFILEAMEVFGCNVLHYTCAGLRSSRRVVGASVLRWPSSFKHAASHLRGDAAFVLELLDRLEAVGSGGSAVWVVQHCSFGVRGDLGLMRRAMALNAACYEHAEGEALWDYGLATQAVSSHGHLIQYVPPALLDRQLGLLAARRTPSVVGCLPEEFIVEHLEVLLVALERDASVVAYAPSCLLRHPDVLAMLPEASPEALPEAAPGAVPEAVPEAAPEVSL